MTKDKLKIPNHVAIILDGNGRWAQEKNMTRSEGHWHGFNNLETLSDYIFEKGVKILSVYAFSTENFKRSKTEVNYLMHLFSEGFKRYSKRLAKKNVKIVFSGRRDPLPKKVLKIMDKVTEDTKNNTDCIFNICVNYGGQYEILDAVKKVVNDIKEDKIKEEDLDLDMLNHYMYQDLAPVDLMIRTSGEHRLSNFLLWQNAYAEFYFPKTYFPAFDEKEFDKAIVEYNQRNRRFGGINYENENS